MGTLRGRPRPSPRPIQAEPSHVIRRGTRRPAERCLPKAERSEVLQEKASHPNHRRQTPLRPTTTHPKTSGLRGQRYIRPVDRSHPQQDALLVGHPLGEPAGFPPLDRTGPEQGLAPAWRLVCPREKDATPIPTSPNSTPSSPTKRDPIWAKKSLRMDWM